MAHPPTLTPHFEYKVYITLRQMLTQRGYRFLEDWETEQTPEELEVHRNKESPIITMVTRDGDARTSGKDDKIVVFYPKHPKLGVKHIRLYMIKLNDAAARHGIVITAAPITHFARKELRVSACTVFIYCIITHTCLSHFSNCSHPPICPIQSVAPIAQMELFVSHQLCQNITHHRLYTPHIPLYGDERKDVMSKYFCSDEVIPMIKTTDPIVLFFNFPKGTLLKIGPRRMGHMPPHYYYRLVT